MTVEEYLQAACDKFLLGLGSTPYDEDVPEGFKALYREQATEHEALIDADWDYLQMLCEWGGGQAAVIPRSSANVTMTEVVAANHMMRERSEADHNHPTVFCIAAP